jgi:L-arabinonolactonase
MNNDVSAELIDTIEIGNMLGEGVQWHVTSQTLWWTDIQKACLYRYKLKTKGIKQYIMPERVGCFSFIRPELSIKGNRLNDGRTDRQGRFWAGSMVEHRNNDKQSAALYCLDNAKHCRKTLNDIEISNGLCWSPDGLTMYHADSPKRTIYRYDFEPSTGVPSNKRVFAQTSKNSFPDGACIDSQGCLWSAHWGGRKVVRYSPEGIHNFEIHIPTKQPSCLAFTGKNLDLLVVTSAKQDLTAKQLLEEPQAGHVFIYQLTGVSGLEEAQVRW